ncbi:DotD/TraH family lipoprotein [Leclercia adecarboxylata]|uniref:DotD/TraH family lipoprotein n=1 Tax=Leclercia adecarboxylata TaxID=83655 RepID=A0A482M1Q0_9ENTR|nr:MULTISPECIES: DotD/TraH family lipoprotein [Enterobacteriaceae]MBZ3802743.1 DotD/TraH family lipoprotein [Leclercia adecarboxylata]MBZ3807236.1 DotD/TraH family lipoprotein [Leclercia adecarboxylata]MCD2483675.1 DotD/TraH family lipoprotein [Enterobacter kobei]MCD2510336.1 DotD/TraH family lipoprotein [Enterobacter kobei]MDC6624220.1 DotD/TraH family lipoprotein [Leclercia adecarboxylata]
MNYFMLPGVLAIILLAGCQAPAPAPVSADRYGAASAVGITRHAQYQMWNNGVWSGTTPGATPMAIIRSNSAGVSFDWEGDGVELLAELARARGLQFNYSGVRLPLPVTLHVRDMTFSNVLRVFEAQTAWRATLHQYPGLLQLNFMQPETTRK